MNEKYKNERYRTEGDVLIFCEGVTEIDIKDLYNYSLSTKRWVLRNEFDIIKKIVLPNSVKKISLEVFEDLKNVVIECDKNSYAEKFAKENDLIYS